MEYLDMYLVHWPLQLKPWAYYPVPKEEDFDGFELESTWAGMEKCLELGLCRGIGVSNFSSKKILRLLDFASVPPVVNQVRTDDRSTRIFMVMMPFSFTPKIVNTRWRTTRKITQNMWFLLKIIIIKNKNRLTQLKKLK